MNTVTIFRKVSYNKCNRNKATKRLRVASALCTVKGDTTLKGKKFFVASFCFTMLVVLFAIMSEPPMLFQQFQDEFFFVAGSLLMTSVLRKTNES